jgi:hypothetical protein
MMGNYAAAAGPAIAPYRAGVAAEARVKLLLMLMVAGVAAMQLHHVFVQAVNWDEFFYLSQVHELQRGSLNVALQTVHTRLFAWLPLVPGQEVDQIRAARLVMLACELITVAGIVAVARHFTSTAAAMLAGLAYIGGGFVFQHGFSFRTDTIAAATLMSALWLTLRSDLSLLKCASIAGLVALAAMVTVKSIFYAPAFIGIAIYRLAAADRPSAVAWKFVATGLFALLLLGVLYALHSSGLRADLEGSQAMLGSASGKMFSMGLLPRLDYVITQALLAPIVTLAVLAAPVALAAGGRKRAETIALAGLYLPIATLLIYRNSFPYYYVFMLPPVLAASAVTLPALIRRYGAPALGAILFGNALLLYFYTPKHMQQVQREVLQAAHTAFPGGTAYFDFCSMLSSFPKQGFFMSGWGTESYRERGRPVFKEMLARDAVPLVVANHAGLLDALRGVPSTDPLLPEDASLLRENYVHHWGPLWVAGKRLRAGAGTTFELAVGGLYTLERRAVGIDGKAVAVGDTITLARGRHSLKGPTGGEAVLRWGKRLPRPAIPEPEPGVFGIFVDF